MADAKNTVLFPYETLKKLSMDAFQKFGFSEKEADIIQDVLLTSDLFGIQSHGMQRMVRYHKGITNGLIKIDAKPEIVKENPVLVSYLYVTPTTMVSLVTMLKWLPTKA